MRTTSALLQSLGGAALFLSAASVGGCASVTAVPGTVSEGARAANQDLDEALTAEGSAPRTRKTSEGSCGEGSCGEGSCGRSRT